MSEWDMNGFQNSFPRAKDRIKYEDHGNRALYIQLFTRLYNLRSNIVGTNQICSSFMPNLQSYMVMNEDGILTIAVV